MDQIKVGRFIASLRKEKGLTQEQLSEKLCVTSKTISRWENGNYMPDIEMLQDLSSFFSVSVNELLSGQRLEGEEFKDLAEENLVEVMKQSSFTLSEHMNYYKEKWIKEHLFTMVAITLLGLFALFLINRWIIKNHFIAIIIFVLFIFFEIFHFNNRMMIYVESKVFDGKTKFAPEVRKNPVSSYALFSSIVYLICAIFWIIFLIRGLDSATSTDIISRSIVSAILFITSIIFFVRYLKTR